MGSKFVNDKYGGGGKREKGREEFEGREGVSRRYLTFLTEASIAGY